MLLRLDAIDEIGRFATLRHRAEQFNRLSLVFARNGYGKSTVCAILRSASESQPNYIGARRRLGAKKETRVQTTWASGATIAFSGGNWNLKPGKVYIFDQEFVNQNIYVGEEVTRDNKRRLLPVVLGEQGVRLSQKILELDKEQRDLDAVMRAAADIIHAKCPIITKDELAAFCNKAVPDDIEQNLERAARNAQLAKQALAVRQKPNLKAIELHDLAYFREIAGRTLASVSADAAERVRLHSAKHDLGDRWDRWLKYGIEHTHGETCPFCDQPIRGIDLITAYETYFSEAFAKLASDRDEAIAELDTVAAEGAIDLVITSNDTDIRFWSTVCEMTELPALGAEDGATVASGLLRLRVILGRKVANPLEVVLLGEDEDQINAAFGIVNRYNSAIARCRATVDGAKVEAQQADVPKAELAHAKWAALAGKRSEPLISSTAKYSASASRKTEIEREKKVAQASLTTYAETAMLAREKEINCLLENFGASFRIANAKANYRGREPNTEYAIAIGEATILAGEKSDTEPSFKTVLSAGDKTTLALAFFISQARSDPKLDQAVVVFDDPCNSQDIGRQFETSSQIRAVASLARQTVVLSHDPRFLRTIEKDADASTTRSFQLLCTDAGSGTVEAWSSENELKALYVQQAETIREFASQGKLLRNVTHMEILQAIRPFLEDYIKARFPGRFAERETLKPMIDAISDKGPDDPMYPTVSDLTALNEYTRVNMHGGGQAADPVALRAQAKKVIKIVGQY